MPLKVRFKSSKKKIYTEIMTIGEVARQAGLRASAIRYYEKAGLLPRPGRISGRRRYDDGILELLAVLEHAKACGFTLAETRQLFGGLRNERPVSERWRNLACEKIAELDALASRIAAMRGLLERIQRCRCLDVRQCGRAILKSRNNLPA
jgi:DNA-binding transcriptional MerR regulator